eukprot:8423-Prorocentrum_minimum.AAC.1
MGIHHVSIGALASPVVIGMWCEFLSYVRRTLRSLHRKSWGRRNVDCRYRARHGHVVSANIFGKRIEFSRAGGVTSWKLNRQASALALFRRPKLCGGRIDEFSGG